MAAGLTDHVEKNSLRMSPTPYIFGLAKLETIGQHRANLNAPVDSSSFVTLTHASPITISAQTMTKRFAAPLATLATVAVLTLTGCSAGSLTGPDTDAQLRAPEAKQIVIERGAIQRNAPHNDEITKSEEGPTSTKAPAYHNELPDDIE